MGYNKAWYEANRERLRAKMAERNVMYRAARAEIEGESPELKLQRLERARGRSEKAALRRNRQFVAELLTQELSDEGRAFLEWIQRERKYEGVFLNVLTGLRDMCVRSKPTKSMEEQNGGETPNPRAPGAKAKEEEHKESEEGEGALSLDRDW